MQDQSLSSLTHAELIEQIEHLRQRVIDLEALCESKSIHRVLLDESSDPIFMFGPDGQYRYVNNAFAEGVKKPIETIIGHKIWDVFSPEEADRRYAVVKWVFENAQTRVIEVRVPRDDGDRFYLTTVKPIVGEAGQVTSVICISKEITDRKHAEQELMYLSTHDTLTGLYNRAFFESELVRLQASRLFPISILVADMDNLKVANDQYGHSTGDELIRTTAQVLRQSFRAEDIIARTGGDEFVVVLPETNQAAGQEAVQRLRENLAAQVDPPIHISIGIATAIEGEHLHTVLRTADDRMYHEKALHKKAHSQVWTALDQR
jgi:diguanylate cyclase (GGDEF)-like protein/PAS domain S-box-containing protein